MTASLHSLTTVLAAPSFVQSDPDGQVRPGGVQGWFHRDRRALARLTWGLDGMSLVAVGRTGDGPASMVFHSVARSSGEAWRDSTLHVRHTRQVFPSTLVEQLDITNHGDRRSITVTLDVATDFAGVDDVKADRAMPLVPPSDDLTWRDDRGSVTLSASPAGTVQAGRVTWKVTLNAGETWRVWLDGVAEGVPGAFDPQPALEAPQWTNVAGVGSDLADLRALLLADGGDQYLAAGSPWYLTLFGRDALWAARLLLPLGTDLAAGTLRALARRQGTRHDPNSEQEPGKILHEIRTSDLDNGDVQLSSLYYGTVDATPLWVCLLHEAWQAGMPVDEVRALMPNLAAAMKWITGQEFLTYRPSTTGGLSHQGWKDSHDAFLHSDGSRPAAPIALCEAQGYAHAAAVGAAELAAAFGLSDGPLWTEWAGGLRARFQDRFWTVDDAGRYPAIALDGDDRPVEGATSNMGHLLGTGLLDPTEAALVAARLGQPDLLTPFGLRTLSATSPVFNPFSYHRGSIWPHDTAIAMTGLVAGGHHSLAMRLADSLLQVSAHFGGHTPELFAVVDGVPLAYPASCRPQAWSAAGVVRAALLRQQGPFAERRHP